jgi:hypothetical protein
MMGNSQPVDSQKAPRLVPVIAADMVFTMAQLRAALGLRKETVANAVRAGRLRVARIDHAYFLRGSWVQEWLEASELTKYQRKSGKA